MGLRSQCRKLGLDADQILNEGNEGPIGLGLMYTIEFEEGL